MEGEELCHFGPGSENGGGNLEGKRGGVIMIDRIVRSRKRLQESWQSPSSERGFTLIELLVVIVILGVLAAVVVFSVQGLGDRGQESAVAIDERTIRTAQESYCATSDPPKYGSGEELVEAELLSNLPEYHNVVATNTNPFIGQCNGWSYSVLPTAAAIEPGGAAPGTWSLAMEPLVDAAQNVWRLNSGKVVVLHSRFDVPTQMSMWDPSSDTWSALDPPPAGILNPAGGQYPPLPHAVLRTNCGANCGKVLVSFGSAGGDGNWRLFDPEAPSGSQWGMIAPSRPRGDTGVMETLLDNPATTDNECGSNCGKVLIISRSANESTGSQTPGVLELYDPNKSGAEAFTLLSDSDVDPACPQAGATVTRSRASQLLPDGRVLLIGEDGCGLTPFFAKFFNPSTPSFSDAPSPPAAMQTRGVLAGTLMPDPLVLNNGDLLVGAGTRSGGRNGAPAPASIYRPESGSPGSWLGTVAGCGGAAAGSQYCPVLASLPDGRVLGFTTSRSDRPVPTGDTYVFNYDSTSLAGSTWTQTGNPAPGGDIAPGAAGVGVLLDRRTGSCGQFCDKVFSVGGDAAAVYTP